MKFIGFKLLEEIVKKRELSLSEIKKLLPKNFDDHRDYYVLASLYTGEYIGNTTIDNQKISSGQNPLAFESNKNVANLFYNFPSDTKETVFCTAKADMYFAEQKQKRNDRLITLSIGIIIGIVTAIVTAIATNYFSNFCF